MDDGLTNLTTTTSIERAQDVNAALRLRNCEPLYGFGAGTSDYEYKQTREDPDVFYVEDREIDMRELLTRKLPRPPIEVNLVRWRECSR